MPRALSTEKRQLIMSHATRLFAERGFASTSVADIARVAEVPVGSIYTYFDNKEELVRAIVEEGWTDLRDRLKSGFSATSDPKERIRLLLDTFLPEMLADLDFITILLSEGLVYTRLEEKIEELTSMLQLALVPIARESRGLAGFGKTDLQVALMVYFLGVLDAVRISRSASIGVTSRDVLAFLRRTIQNGLGVDL